MNKSKVHRLEEKGNIGIINFVDNSLDRCNGYRKTARLVREKFNCEISYESIRQYKLWREQTTKPTNQKQNYSKKQYYVCIRPLHETKRKGDKRDKAILRALS